MFNNQGRRFKPVLQQSKVVAFLTLLFLFLSKILMSADAVGVATTSSDQSAVTATVVKPLDSTTAQASTESSQVASTNTVMTTMQQSSSAPEAQAAAANIAMTTAAASDSVPPTAVINSTAASTPPVAASSVASSEQPPTDATMPSAASTPASSASMPATTSAVTTVDVSSATVAKSDVMKMYESLDQVFGYTQWFSGIDAINEDLISKNLSNFSNTVVAVRDFLKSSDILDRLKNSDSDRADVSKIKNLMEDFISMRFFALYYSNAFNSKILGKYSVIAPALSESTFDLAIPRMSDDSLMPRAWRNTTLPDSVAKSVFVVKAIIDQINSLLSAAVTPAPEVAPQAPTMQVGGLKL